MDITIIAQNGKIIFTKVEPFGSYLFDVLDDGTLIIDADYEQTSIQSKSRKIRLRFTL